jgi:hypothetical protein
MDGQLFTWASLGTFTGLTGATVVVTNAISRAVRWNPAWFGLLVALVLCLGLAISNGKTALTDYALAILNACLVYVSAAGTNSVGAATTAPESTTEGPGGAGGFFRNWF